MIKSKLKIPKITKAKPISFQITSVTTYDLLNDTREFLNYYFKGAYKNCMSAVSYRRADLSIDGFSYILKILFKSVFGRSMIIVSDALLEKEIAFIVEFDTSVISDDDLKIINEAAEKSNIKLELSKDNITLKIPTRNDFVPTVSAVSTRNVYNSLLNIFFGL